MASRATSASAAAGAPRPNGLPSYPSHPSSHPPSSSAPITSEERHLLTSLIESGQFGPGVKALFDRQFAGSTLEWERILMDSVRSKQGEIKRICEGHYSEFLSGIDHLLSVKLDLSELRDLASGLNEAVQRSGRAVVDTTRKLAEQRRVRMQINQVSHLLHSCASMVKLTKKAKQQIAATKYFSALKTLHQLQRVLHVAAMNYSRARAAGALATGGAVPPSSNDSQLSAPAGAGALHPALHSPRSNTKSKSQHTRSLTATSLSSRGRGPSHSQAGGAGAGVAEGGEEDEDDDSSTSFEFIVRLERQIPLLTRQIKEKVKEEFMEWLKSISDKSQQLGELAMAQLDESLASAERRRSAQRKRVLARIMHGHAGGGVVDNETVSPTGPAHRRHRRGGRKQAESDEEASNSEEDDDEDGLPSLLGGGGLLSSGALFEHVPVNFTPIYQCLHIYEHLSLAPHFQSLYKDQRQRQLMDVVHSLANLSQADGQHQDHQANTKAGAGAGGKAAPASTSKSSASTSAGAPDFLSLYTRVFSGITGFFLVEDHILKSGNELLSRAEMDAMYDRVQLALIQYLTGHLGSSAAFRSPQAFLQLKHVLVLLCKSMEETYSLGLNSTLLYRFLLEQRPRFERILLRRFAADCGRIFADEKWEPLAISTPKEFELFVLKFALADPGVNVELPATMSFSISVPLITRLLQNLVEDYSMYSRYLDEAVGGGAGVDGGTATVSAGGRQSTALSSSWRSHVLSAVDRALLDEVNATFLNLLRRPPGTAAPAPPIPISQTVQFSINAQVLSEMTCAYLERIVQLYTEEESSELEEVETGLASSPSVSGAFSPLSSPTGTGLSGGGGLSARQVLLSTKLHCEDLIFELIHAKLAQFLELWSEGFDWTPDANQASQEVSEPLLDLLNYLETTLFHLSFMPDAVREAVHFTSCKQVADYMMDTLANPSSDTSCKRFNSVSIHNLHVDLMAMEQFALGCPIQNLVETFSEIRQMVDLLRSGEVEVLLEPAQRAARYPHLSTSKLVRVLDKFREVSMFSLQTPAQFKKLKKKNVEAVVKKLSKGGM